MKLDDADTRFAAYLDRLEGLIASGAVDDADPFPDEDVVREADGDMRATLAKAAGAIKHCGQEGDGYWNPQTKTVWWVAADSDGEENGYTPGREIHRLFSAVPGVKDVQVEYEPPREEREAGDWVPFSGRALRRPAVREADDRAALREKLAALEHEQWAHWTQYQLDEATPGRIAGWRRQITTPYADLSEQEKDADREWADKVLALVGGKEVREVSAATHQTGMMVALYPAAAVCGQLALPDGERPDELHLTLAYLGKTGDYDDEQLDALPDVVAAAVRGHAALHGRVSGLATFAPTAHSDGKEVLHATVDIPGLLDLRRAIVDALDSAGYTVAKNFEYHPHLTLRYQDEGAPLPSLEQRPALRFGQVTTCIGAKRSQARLGRGGPHDSELGAWKRINGAPCYIQDGVVIKGPPGLQGKHLS